MLCSWLNTLQHVCFLTVVSIAGHFMSGLQSAYEYPHCRSRRSGQRLPHCTAIAGGTQIDLLLKDVQHGVVACDGLAVDAALLRHDMVPLDAEAEGGAAHRVRTGDVRLEVVPEVARQVRLHAPVRKSWSLMTLFGQEPLTMHSCMCHAYLLGDPCCSCWPCQGPGTATTPMWPVVPTLVVTPTLWPPMMGDPPNSVFLWTHVSQLEGPPPRLCHTAPLFCHTEMAVPAWKGASAAGALQGRRKSCGVD